MSEKKSPLKKIMFSRFFLQKKRLNFNLCFGKKHLLNCNIFLYISILLSKYQVNLQYLLWFLLATSVQMSMFSFSPEHYDRLQEMVLKGSFRHFLERDNVLK